MSSEIGNKGILRAIGEALKILDSKQSASRLDTSQIVTALQLSPGWASYEPFHVRMGQGGDIVSAGEEAITLPLIAANPAAYTSSWGGNSQALTNQNREYVILGIDFSFAYDLTSTPDAGKELYFQFLRRYNNSDPNTAITCGIYSPWQFVRSGELTYRYAMPFWSRYTTSGNPFESWQYVREQDKMWVPAGSDLAISAGGGTPFPNGTIVNCSFWGVSCPKGLTPPLCG